jgi:hypothetical protein
MMMTGIVVVPFESPRIPTKQQRMLSMEIETNLKLVQLPNDLQPAIVMEVFNLDKRDSSITIVPRGINPPSGLDVILIELLHFNEK